MPSYEALTPQNLDAPEVLPTADDVEPMEIGSIWSKLSKGERESGGEAVDSVSIVE